MRSQWLTSAKEELEISFNHAFLDVLNSSTENFIRQANIKFSSPTETPEKED